MHWRAVGCFCFAFSCKGGWGVRLCRLFFGLLAPSPVGTTWIDSGTPCDESERLAECVYRVIALSSALSEVCFYTQATLVCLVDSMHCASSQFSSCGLFYTQAGRQFETRTLWAAEPCCSVKSRTVAMSQLQAARPETPAAPTHNHLIDLQPAPTRIVSLHRFFCTAHTHMQGTSS